LHPLAATLAAVCPAAPAKKRPPLFA